MASAMVTIQHFVDILILQMRKLDIKVSDWAWPPERKVGRAIWNAGLSAPPAMSRGCPEALLQRDWSLRVLLAGKMQALGSLDNLELVWEPRAPGYWGY